MKTKFVTLLVLAAFVFTTQLANAKIFRVGYWGKAIAGQDQPDLQSAHNAASAGDTLLIFPGTWTASFGKKLIVIGYGYFLSGAAADSGYQVITGNMNIGIDFALGSDSTVLEGLNGLTATVRNNVAGVSISYCNLILGDIYGWALINWKITKSYVNISAAYNAIYQGIYFANNVITASSFVTSSNSTGTFNNNIFTSTPNFNNGSYQLYNNIFLSTVAPSNTAACIFDYNIASNNILPNNAPYNHNKNTVNLSTLFVSSPSNDARYMLAPGSPAIGAGENGIDCGIFGGKNPYRLAGIPPIPSFYKLTAPTGNTMSTTPYVIIFSVRGNN